MCDCAIHSAQLRVGLSPKTETGSSSSKSVPVAYVLAESHFVSNEDLCEGSQLHPLQLFLECSSYKGVFFLSIYTES